MTASGKMATKQNKYRELLDQVVSFIKGPNFKAYAHKVHKAVGWKELADRLSSANDKLSSIQQKPTQQNIVEWYFEVTQINTEILTNLASAIATHTAETATHIPVIKQLSYLVDQLVIVSLDIGNFIATHLGGNKKQVLSDPDNQNQLSTMKTVSTHQTGMTNMDCTNGTPSIWKEVSMRFETPSKRFEKNMIQGQKILKHCGFQPLPQAFKFVSY